MGCMIALFFDRQINKNLSTENKQFSRRRSIIGGSGGGEQVFFTEI